MAKGTKKRCLKSYLVNGYFLHRNAFKGMYKKQTESKSWRKMSKTFENYYGRFVHCNHRNVPCLKSYAGPVIP